MTKDVLRFFGRYIVNPRFTGSVCPSSRFLSRKMVSGASLKRGGLVLELGPGTGPVTKCILECGVAAQNIYSIEFDPTLAQALRARYPQINVITGSAEDLSTHLGERKEDLKSIISSLPLVSLPDPVVKKIIKEIESVLPKGGTFVQFTYNLCRKPSSLGFTRMRHIKTSFVPINIPPARVDVFERV